MLTNKIFLVQYNDYRAVIIGTGKLQVREIIDRLHSEWGEVTITEIGLSNGAFEVVVPCVVFESIVDAPVLNSAYNIYGSIENLRFDSVVVAKNEEKARDLFTELYSVDSAKLFCEKIDLNDSDVINCVVNAYNNY